MPSMSSITKVRDTDLIRRTPFGPRRECTKVIEDFECIITCCPYFNRSVASVQAFHRHNFRKSILPRNLFVDGCNQLLECGGCSTAYNPGFIILQIAADPEDCSEQLPFHITRIYLQQRRKCLQNLQLNVKTIKVTS